MRPKLRAQAFPGAQSWPAQPQQRTLARAVFARFGLGLSAASPWSDNSGVAFGIGAILWLTLTQFAASRHRRRQARGCRRQCPASARWTTSRSMLLRGDKPDTAGASGDLRQETVRILANSVENGSLAADDRAYLAKRIAARTGLDQAAAKSASTTSKPAAPLPPPKPRPPPRKPPTPPARPLPGRPVADRCHAARRLRRQLVRHPRRRTARRRCRRDPSLIRENLMRSILLWLVGIPIPIIILLAIMF